MPYACLYPQFATRLDLNKSSGFDLLAFPNVTIQDLVRTIPQLANIDPLILERLSTEGELRRLL